MPDPLMCATLHAPAESSLADLWAADEAAEVVMPTQYALHRPLSSGITGYSTALSSITRALAPGGSVATTPTVQHQGVALDAELEEHPCPKRL